ncbi:hypothetical protein EZS27_016850 [termite gut metagenome]|uniref:Uncharacterized protein n=1 Tax=termite gut metagenome TaxID=433724 RepID=A0A5J4R524_9ZZZZ
MKLNRESQSLIEATIKESVNKYIGGFERMEITDIHIQATQSSGELLIFDDDDRELGHTVINDWTTYNGDTFYESIERVLRSILVKMKEAGSFENLTIFTPYSFVLVDEYKETVAELLLIDDDIMLVSEELLKGVDKELDDFLRELLKS